MAALVIVGMLYTGEVELFLLITGPAIAISGYWLSLKILSAKYTINISSINIQDIWGRRGAEWKQVKNVWIHNNFFGSYNINLELENGKRYLVYTSFIGNCREVAQAIIEAATSSNPQVQLRGLGQYAYGAPPYGIFTEQG